MPNYTPNYGLYQPSDVTDSFGSTFLPETTRTMGVIDDLLKELFDGAAGGGASGDIIFLPSGGDDTAAFQTALNDAVAQNKRLVVGGTYTLSSPVTVTGRIEILSYNAVFNVTHKNTALTFIGTNKNLTPTATTYNAGDDFLVLSSTAGIEKGDLVRFCATTEQYHPSRSYYYKGGSVVVTHVQSDRIYFSDALPFSMAAIDVVQIYKPGQVKIEGRMDVINTATSTTQTSVSAGSMGVKLERCAGFEVEGLFVDGFDTNITPVFCTGGTFRSCRTGRAYYWTVSGTTNVNSGGSYGFSTVSSRDIHYEDCHTRSGRHGHTGGGNEPLDRISFKNCSFFNEHELQTTAGFSVQYAFDLHDNAIKIDFENCDFDSFTIIGNCTMTNCTVHHKGRTDSSYKPGDDPMKNSYIFDNVIFPNVGSLRCVGAMQSGGTWTGQDRISNITLRNVVTSGTFILYAAMSSPQGANNASAPTVTINDLTIENCKNVHFWAKDNINNLTLRNVYNDQSYNHLYQIAPASPFTSATGKLDNILIENCHFGNKYLGMNLTNFGKMTIINSDVLSTAETAGRFLFQTTGARVIMIGSDFSALQQGINFNLGSGSGKRTIIDSPYTLYGATGDVAILNETVLRSKVGQSTQNGDGTKTAFTIAHGLGVTPSSWIVQEASAAAGTSEISYVTADATNLTVNFKTAPATGTGNVVMNWRVDV
ncbi:hypothetical protein [Fictibacillus sp. NRS-1165]|uniref:hypothetical protein n=1 Tax=Fictibacillus sp. NRS-1165 TaxID=3144463 RepID=UPI003D22EE8C